MPRSPSTLVRLPLDSELLMRSPVEARCAGVADILRIPSELFYIRVCKYKPRNPVQLRVCKYSFFTSGLASTSPETRLSGMNRNQSDDVIVHDVGKEQQKEHEADLNEAFFHRHAQITAHQAFDTQQQDLAAIENRNRQQIENAQVDADESHQRNNLRRSAVHCIAGNLRDADHALQLLDRGASAEQFSNDSKSLGKVIAGA